MKSAPFITSLPSIAWQNEATHEWYDNVFAIYEFQTPAGPVRSQYQVLTTTSAGGGYQGAEPA